jgi:hypothetical protein
MTIKINLGKMKNPHARAVRAAIAFNNERCVGKGNRAKRRRGIPVVNEFMSRPFGAVAMNQKQIAEMMKGGDMK